MSVLKIKKEDGTWESIGGGGGSSTTAIIDVLELPIENINENAFYRVLTAKYIYNKDDDNPFICHCVQSLPETGKVCTDATMSFVITYYSLADNEAYGYVDADLGTLLDIAAGWYPVSTLVSYSGIPYSGIITDINDDPCDDTLRILLGYDYYIYQNEWCKIPFAYEKAPKFDIQWDGVIGDKFALDLSSLGYTNIYMVKISDRVFTSDELIGATYTQSIGYYCTITENEIDSTTFPGALSIDGGGLNVVYSGDDFGAAIGAPAGYITNGTYFIYVVDEFYTNRLIAPPRITKIDKKYLPDIDVDISSLGLHSVATSGNYNDLYNKPNLSDYATTTEVEAMIANAIGTAIGGSY